MKIGELARRAGVSAQTIRYYENIGILPEAGRQPNGYRIYDASAVKRLGFVRDAQTSGLTLTEIQMVLDMKDSGESPCGHVISLLEQHMIELDLQLGELERTRRRIEEMTARAREMDPAQCTDPDRCQTISRKEARHD